MPRTKLYNRRGREEQIAEQQEKAIQLGTLYKKAVRDDDGKDVEVFRNRTLIQACEWRIESKKASKKSIVKELKERAKWAGGRREIKKIEKAIKHFSG